MFRSAMRVGAAIPVTLVRPANRSVFSVVEASFQHTARPSASTMSAWTRAPTTAAAVAPTSQIWALSPESRVLLASTAGSPSPLQLEESTVDDEDGSTSSRLSGLAEVLGRVASEPAMELESVVRKRKRKMNHHRYRKRRRLQRFLRRKHEN